MMGQKITGWVAFFGLSLVVLSFALNLFLEADLSVRSMLMITGFTMMLLGTIWRVVLEMNEEDEERNS